MIIMWFMSLSTLYLLPSDNFTRMPRRLQRNSNDIASLSISCDYHCHHQKLCLYYTFKTHFPHCRSTRLQRTTIRRTRKGLNQKREGQWRLQRKITQVGETIFCVQSISDCFNASSLISTCLTLNIYAYYARLLSCDNSTTNIHTSSRRQSSLIYIK